jgi:hypothetical protein
LQSVPSWDLFLAIFFVVSIGYSFVLQRDKVIVTLLAIYAGIVIAGVLGGPLQSFFNGDKTVANQLFIRANASPFSIQSGLFLIVTVLLSMRSGLGGRGSNRGVLSNFELAIFSLLNSALILAAVFSFMAPAAQADFAAHSRIAKVIIDHISWWFVAPLVAVVATGGVGKGRSND